MDLLDRLLAHDTWTTRQLLMACESLPDELLDKEFDIDQHSLRQTFIHIIGNMELWTDLLCQRPVQDRTGNTIPELLKRLSLVSREFANVARKIAREQRYDDCFLDTLDNPPRLKTFDGGEAIQQKFCMPVENIRPSRLAPPSPSLLGHVATQELLLRAYRFNLLHGTAPLLSLQRSRVIPKDYQLVPVVMALAESARVRHLLLLTATPHNGYIDTFASLLRLLDVGAVSGPPHEPAIHREVARRYVCQRRRQDVEEWFQDDPDRSPFPRRDQREVIVVPSAYEKEAIDAVKQYGETILASARSGSPQT